MAGCETHTGRPYPVATIDGGTGWHWTCCDHIDTEDPT